jgi:hypothetical protein
MNKAQKIIQPLIDVSLEGLDRDALTDAFNALATLPDAITLADVPAVEWNVHPPLGGRDEIYEHMGWLAYKTIENPPRTVLLTNEGKKHYAFATIAHTKRIAEIRIHLAALERKLLAELAGGA